MSQIEIEKSLNLLEKDWDIDPLLRDFMLGKVPDVGDFAKKVKDVVFHIPFFDQREKIHFMELLLA